MPRPSGFSTLLLLSAGLAAPPSLAQESDAPMGPPPSAETNPLGNPVALFSGAKTVGASLGGGQMDGDWYVQGSASLDFDLGDIGIGVLVPLNLLAYSAKEPPKREDKTYFNVLRKSDWPSPNADNYGRYLALVRYLRYGHKRDPVYAYYGQVNAASLGHGTILDRYSNSLDPNRPRRGLALDLNADFGGVETFVNDVAWPATNVFGARAYVRPLGWGEKPTPLLGSWAVGASIVDDHDAPLALASDGGVDAAGLPKASKTSRVVVGVDTEIELLRNALLEVIPYIDYNFQLGAGSGLHAGTLGNIRLSALASLWARLEYRYMAPDYIPSYFDTFYDQQRYAYSVGSGQVPKAAAGAVLKAISGNWHHGIYGDATLQVLGLVQAGAQLYGTPGVKDSKTVTVFATLPKADFFKVAAWYMRKDFDAWGDIVALDQKSRLSALGLVKLMGPLYLMALFQRGWSVDAAGKVASSDTWRFGLQTYFEL